MKKNVPNLAKEIDFQGVQEVQRVLKKLDSRKHTPRYITITLPKIKDKERNLKAARGKETVIYKGVPKRLSADLSNIPFLIGKKLRTKETNFPGSP